MKIRLTVKHNSVTAKLVDNPTTRDFVSLLPLTLRMSDLAKREKFGHLPQALCDDGRHTHTYALGDIAYWPPGPDIAIFYHHDGERIPHPGIVVIGKIGAAVQAFDEPGSLTVTMELVR